MTDEEYKICDICKDKTNCNYDLLFFGDWQQSREITVHYFCLLLSTNLPQRGKDCSGINGFLVRDIRKEITAASKRLCCYCGRSHASVQCYKCNEYFHIRCGRQNRCLFTFNSDFRSYCDECVPKKEIQPAGLRSRPSSFERCSICREQMGLYNEIIFIFGKCCNKGFAHSVCVQKYALAAGYYLRCLWCRSAEFRISVRQQGIFVPDRDARWEIQKGTYTDLHRGHSTCNMDKCFCPRGRDYNKGKWSVILCSLCGSVGAHNPKCLLGKENAKEPVTIFKCATCARTESMVINKDDKEATTVNNADIIDKSIFMTKTNNIEKEKVAHNFTPCFSEDDDTRSSDSFVTVIPLKPLEYNNSAIATRIGEQFREDNNNGNFIRKNDDNVMPVKIFNNLNINTEKDVAKVQLGGAENIIVERSTQQPLIFNVEDEETQICVVPSPDIHKTKAVEEPTLLQHSLALDVLDDDETQVFAISSPDIIEVTKLSTKAPLEEENLTEASSTTAMPCADPIPEMSCPETTNPIDSNQSPVVTSSSQIEDHEEWVSFVVYEYDETKGKCIGSATVRINLNEERFAGMNLEQVEEHSYELITDADIISRTADIGIFAKIDAIIAEYA